MGPENLLLPVSIWVVTGKNRGRFQDKIQVPGYLPTGKMENIKQFSVLICKENYTFKLFFFILESSKLFV